MVLSGRSTLKTIKKPQSCVVMIELPPEIAGPSAWYGPDIADRAEWIEQLSSAELSEIESASQRLDAVGT